MYDVLTRSAYKPVEQAVAKAGAPDRLERVVRRRPEGSPGLFRCLVIARLLRVFALLLCFAQLVMIFAPCSATHLNIHLHRASWFIASDRAATSLANE